MEEKIVVTVPSFGGIGLSTLGDFGIYHLRPQKSFELSFEFEKSELKRMATLIVAAYVATNEGDPSVFNSTLLWPEFEKHFQKKWSEIQKNGGQHDPRALKQFFQYYRARCPR